MNLSRKTVLLLAPKFFGYELEIKKELENLGCELSSFSILDCNTLDGVPSSAGEFFDKEHARHKKQGDRCVDEPPLFPAEQHAEMRIQKIPFTAYVKHKRTCCVLPVE